MSSLRVMPTLLRSNKPSLGQPLQEGRTKAGNQIFM
uniref:Uncharacterized protein n=1 Tax=Rhizophora mucronata TaxID=61149 RepID=A0A2P2P6A3_RHIMU